MESRGRNIELHESEKARIAGKVGCDPTGIHVEGISLKRYYLDIPDFWVQAPPYYVSRQQSIGGSQILGVIFHWDQKHLQQLSAETSVKEDDVRHIWSLFQSHRSVAAFQTSRIKPVPEDLGAWRGLRLQFKRYAKHGCSPEELNELLMNPLALQVLEYIVYGTTFTPLENRHGYIEVDCEVEEGEDLYSLIEQPDKLRPIFERASQIKGTTNRQLPNWVDSAVSYMRGRGYKRKQFLSLVGPLIRGGEHSGIKAWHKSPPQE